MSTCTSFGRINLNIQIEIGLYDENVSLFLLVCFVFFLLVACISYKRKQPQKPYIHSILFSLTKKNLKLVVLIRQINHLVISCEWLRSTRKHSIRFWEEKTTLSARNNALRRVFGNVVNVLPTNCLHSTISLSLSILQFLSFFPHRMVILACMLHARVFV